MLSDRDRQRLHLQIAEAIEQLATSDDAVVSELAYHFAEAGTEGDPLRAVRYLGLAAEKAVGSHAYDEAVGLLEWAVSLAEGAPAGELALCDALIRLSDAQWRASKDHTAAVRRAADIALEAEDGELLARALLQGWSGSAIASAHLNDDPVLRERLARALELLGVDGPPRLVAEVRILQAAEHAVVADLDERARLCGDAVEAARMIGEPDLLANALGTRCIAINHPSTLDARRRDRDELLELRPTIQSLEELLTATQVGVTVTLQEGSDRPTRLIHLARQQEVADASRLSNFEGVAMFTSAVVSTLEGNLDGAEGQLVAAVELMQHEPVWAQSAAGALTIMLRREQGRIQEVVPMLEHVAEEFGQPPVWMSALSLSHALAGHDRQARDGLDWFAGIGLARLPRNALWAVTLGMLAEALIEVGGHDLAGDIEELLAPWTDQFVFEGGTACFGAVAHHVGRLQALSGRHDEAQASLEQALRIHERMEAGPWASRTRLALAATKQRRGDIAGARSLLQAARTEARAAGWKGVVNVADQVQLEVNDR